MPTLTRHPNTGKNIQHMLLLISRLEKQATNIVQIQSLAVSSERNFMLNLQSAKKLASFSKNTILFKHWNALG